MSIPLTINGATFEYPQNFDENWGINATGWAQAVTNGMLQMQGGSFPLTADVNFGPNFGLLSKYFETRSANPATTGTVRLSSADAGVVFRNHANSGNLVLTTDASDNLLFNGSTFGTGGNVTSGIANQLAYYPASTNSVSGLTLITASRALVSDTNGLPVASTVTTTTLAFLDATSSVQTQLNSISTVANAALPKAGGTMSGPIAMGANKITGMADGTAAQDATTVNQLTVLIPSGIILDFGGTATPTGWLLCDGSVVAQATYPSLFAAIGATWNTGGEGAGNFRLPSLSRRVTVGSGGSGTATLGNTVGSIGGSETHTLTQAELSVALGTATSVVTDPTHAHQQVGIVTGGGATQTAERRTDASATVGMNNTNPASTGITVATTITNGSGGNAHSIIQPSAVVLKIIKI